MAHEQCSFYDYLYSSLLFDQFGEKQMISLIGEPSDLINDDATDDSEMNPDEEMTPEDSDDMEADGDEDSGSFKIGEPNDTIDDANDSGISPDGERVFEQTSNLNGLQDVDFISFELDKGDVAIIDVDTSGDINTELRIFDSEGTEVGTSINNAALDETLIFPDETLNPDSYIEFTAKSDGKYYAGVSPTVNEGEERRYDPVTGEFNSSFGGSGGDYNISITVFNGKQGTTAPNDLNGTEEADYIAGLRGNDTLVGGDGDDFLRGGDLNDNLQGGDGNDTLSGDKNNDNLVGGNGDDFLKGGEGSDRLTGGEGADQFILSPTQTGETILDFEDGEDSFLLIGGIAFDDLDISPSSGNAVIKFEDTTLATVEDVDTDMLTELDFIAF
jgi:Ca2+-binding RTX toxin-like protein